MTHHRTSRWRGTDETSSRSIHEGRCSRWAIGVEDITIHTALCAASHHTATTTVVRWCATSAFVGLPKSVDVRLTTERLPPPCSRVVFGCVFLFDRVCCAERNVVVRWLHGWWFVNVFDTCVTLTFILMHEADNARRVRGVGIWERTFHGYWWMRDERTITDVLSTPGDCYLISSFRLGDVTDFVVAFANTLVITRNYTPWSWWRTWWRVTFIYWGCTHIGRIGVITMGAASREMVNDLPSNTFSQRTCKKIMIKNE